MQCEPACHISRKTLLISTKTCESIKWTSMYCCPSWHPVTILIAIIVVLTLSCCYLGHRCLSCWYFGPEIIYHTQRRHFYQLYGSIKTTDLSSAPFMSILHVSVHVYKGRLSFRSPPEITWQKGWSMGHVLLCWAWDHRGSEQTPSSRKEVGAT